MGLRTRRIGLCANDNGSKSNDSRTNDSVHNSYDISTKKNKHNDDKDKSKNQNNVISTNNVYQRKMLSTVNHKLRKYLKITMSKFKLINYDFCFWPRIQNSKMEFLVLPTGNGGILYRPRFFHKIIFDPILRGLTLYNDDLTFRLSTMANKIYVVNGCCERLEHCGNKTMGTNNMKILPPEDAFTELRNQLLLSNNYPKKSIENVRTDAINDSSLYSKNLYWNTNMWRSGIAYLKHKKIMDIADYYDIKFLLYDRPECFHNQKIIDRKQCGMYSSCFFI